VLYKPPPRAFTQGFAEGPLSEALGASLKGLGEPPVDIVFRGAIRELPSGTPCCSTTIFLNTELFSSLWGKARESGMLLPAILEQAPEGGATKPLAC